jgi:ABC-type hemin transport system ATPase subunit
MGPRQVLSRVELVVEPGRLIVVEGGNGAARRRCCGSPPA